MLRRGVFIFLMFALMLLILFILFVFQSSFSRSGDGVHPEPFVEIVIQCVDGSWERVNGSGVVNCQVGRRFRVIVKLINLGDEPSPEGIDTAAGVLLAFDGGRVANYSLGDFDWAIGVAENLEVTEVNGSRIIELFSKSIKGRDMKIAYFDIDVDEKAANVKLSYRGWILDEDDKVLNPLGEKEPYCARYPPEDPVDNPPDSRWSGKEFMKYKTFKIIIPVVH